MVSALVSIHADGADSKMLYYTLLVAWHMGAPSGMRGSIFTSHGERRIERMLVGYELWLIELSGKTF
jgi:hypothetical protein